MNIFAVEWEPHQAARALCDKHVGKMLVESAQMLSTVARGKNISAPYKSTHHNHPCTKWTRESHQNWSWLLQHAIALNHEWKIRFGKSHKTGDALAIIEKIPPFLPSLGLTPFAQAMPEEFKDSNPVVAYRRYYHTKTFASWTRGRHSPVWWLL